jgi:hypothetical protein
MTVATYFAHQLRRLANTLHPAGDPARMYGFLARGEQAPPPEQSTAPDSAYWPDKEDPMGQVHGHDKCVALEKKLFAMTVVAWMAHAGYEAKVAAADVIRRRVPGFDGDFLGATQAAIDFTGTLQYHLNEDAIAAQQTAASAPQDDAAPDTPTDE